MTRAFDALIDAATAERMALLAPIYAPRPDPAPSPPIGIGTRVKYTRAFMKAILEPPTGRLWALEATVLDVGARWLTILRDGEHEPLLVKPTVVQRAELPTVEASGGAELGYAGVFGFEAQWKGEEAEALRIMGGGI
jgi:hypothetical protein